MEDFAYYHNKLYLTDQSNAVHREPHCMDIRPMSARTRISKVWMAAHQDMSSKTTRTTEKAKMRPISMATVTTAKNGVIEPEIVGRRKGIRKQTPQQMQTKIRQVNQRRKIQFLWYMNLKRITWTTTYGWENQGHHATS